MDIFSVENALAQRIAEAMIDGFNRHYRLIRRYGQQAKALFEAADWKGVHDAVRERIRSYDDRVRETAELLCANFGAATLDDATWQQLKLFYNRASDQPSATGTRGNFLQLGVLENPSPNLLQQ
jgi:isocitrate dehydrogenase kinase/phosphatase